MLKINDRMPNERVMIIYIRIRPAVRGYRQILLARVHIYRLDNLDTFTAKYS